MVGRGAGYARTNLASYGIKTAVFAMATNFEGKSSSDRSETIGNGSAVSDLPSKLPLVPYFSLRGH